MEALDRAGEVGRVVRLEVLDHAVVVDVGRRVQTARDHRQAEDPVVDHLVRVDEMRVRGRLLRDDPRVGGVQQVVQALPADEALEADDVAQAGLLDQPPQAVLVRPTAREDDAQVRELVA